MIPYKFNRLGIDESKPLTFIAAEANSTIKLTAVGSPTVSGLKYRTRGGGWQSYTIDDTITLTNKGDYIQYENSENTLSTSNANYCKFVMTGKIKGSGNIQSLVNYADGISAYGFYYLFNGCTSLTQAPALTAKAISTSCY